MARVWSVLAGYLTREKRTIKTRILAGVGAVAFLLTVVLLVLLWSDSGASAFVRSRLGVTDASAFTLDRTATVVLAGKSQEFSPPSTAVLVGGSVTFVNGSGRPMVVRTAALSPATFYLRMAPHSRATTNIARVGLYHYYDVLTARPGRTVKGNQVVLSRDGTGAPRQGWIIAIPNAPGLQTRLFIPPSHDLFTPKSLVTIVGSTVTVANHDADAHNFVIDPASPAGAAFIVNGTNDEPPHGWQRSLVVQQPGLYHVYCTLHTRRVGVVNGWQEVVPRDAKASGYKDRNPMEAWIVVLPATAKSA